MMSAVTVAFFESGRQGMQLMRFLRLRRRLPQSEGCDLPAIPSITVATAGGLGGGRWASTGHRTRLSDAHVTAVVLSERRRRNHEREVGMGAQRSDFLLLVTLAAAVVCVTAAFGQAVTPAVGPAGSAAQSAIPDFSGIWSHPYFPGFEPPASGPGPLTNRLRLSGRA